MARLGGRLALWLGCTVSRLLPAQTPATPRCPADPLPPRIAGAAPVYLPCQLDSEAAVALGSVEIQYPRLLEQSGVEGLARVQVIVLASGAVDSASVTVTGSMHPGFNAASRAAVLGAAFTAGKRDGRAVASLVTLDFEFALGEVLRSAAAAESARALARRSDTTAMARVVALRRLAAILGGRVVRVYPFNAEWDSVRHRPVGGCGPYRVYVSPPAVVGPPLSRDLAAQIRGLADSLAGDASVPGAVRAAGWCLARVAGSR